MPEVFVEIIEENYHRARTTATCRKCVCVCAKLNNERCEAGGALEITAAMTVIIARENPLCGHVLLVGVGC